MRAIFADGRSGDGGRPVAQRPVSAVMSSPVTTVDAAASLDDALRLMVGAGVRHLVVLADSSYRGIVSDREIGTAWAADPTCLATQTVDTLLHAPATTVAATTPVVAAARAMRAAGSDAVAVLGPDDAVVGIVTGTDLIALLARYPA